MTRRVLLNAIVAAAFAFVIYIPALRGEFVWDDQYFVRDNPSLREWKFVPQYFTNVNTVAAGGGAETRIYRPLRNIAYLLDYKVWGLYPFGGRIPFGFHLQNLLWHAMTVALLVALAAALTGDAAVAGWTGLLFAAHPVVTEPVCWIKGRDTLMCGAFVVAAAALFVRWLRDERFRGGRFAVIVALYFLALLSYLMAAGALFAFAGYALLFRRWLPRSAPRKTMILLLAMSAVTALFLVLNHHVIGHTAQRDYIVDGRFAKTMITMLPAAAEYLRLLALPWRLNADYLGFPPSRSLLEWRPLAALGLLAAVVFATVWSARRGWTVAAFSLIWIGAFLAPFSNVVPMMQILAERFLYVSCMGFALGAVAMVTALGARGGEHAARAARIALITLLTLYVARTEIRIQDWRSNLTLHRASHEADPANPRVMNNYAKSLLDARAYPEAAALFGTLLQRHSQQPEVFLNLAYSLDGMGQADAALDVLQAGRARHAGDPDISALFAMIASRSGRPDAARQALAGIPQDGPNGYRSRLLTAIARQNLGEMAPARALYESLLGQGPDDFIILANLARLCRQSGDAEAARRYERRVLELNPAHAMGRDKAIE